MPCVFTSIVNSATVVNRGDEKTYPIFNVTCENPTANSTIFIVNHTTKKAININYATSAGEIITVDTFNQRVTSNLYGNITRYVSLDTDFFVLEQGENTLGCDSVGNIITLEYYENYLGV